MHLTDNSEPFTTDQEHNLRLTPTRPSAKYITMLKDLPEKKMSRRVLAPLERIQVSIVQIKNHRLPFSSKITQFSSNSVPFQVNHPTDRRQPGKRSLNHSVSFITEDMGHTAILQKS